MMRVGFSSGHVLLSQVIKSMTHSKASHSYIVFEAAGEELVIQADIHGVCCEHYESFKKNQTIVAEYELTISPEQEHAILAFALRRLLLPYNYLAIIGFAWVLINRKFGRRVKQPFNSKSSYFCSELIIAALQAGMFPLSHSFNVELTSPEDIIEFLEAHPSAKLVYGSHNQ